MNMNQFDLLSSNSLDAIYSAQDFVSNTAFIKENVREVINVPENENISRFMSPTDNFPYETNLPDNTQNVNKILSNNKQKKNRYRKYINTLVTIDSRDRDVLQYPSANKYKVYLNKNMRNIVSISLLDIKIPNTILSIGVIIQQQRKKTNLLISLFQNLI